MKNHSPIHLQVNEKSCRLRMGVYRDGAKRKGDKTRQVHNNEEV